MRFFAITTSAAIVALASAQANLSDLPKCAQECVGTSLANTGCNNLQVKCICEQSAWIAGLSCCVEKACSTDDQAKTISFAAGICKTVGVQTPASAAEACHGAGHSSAGAAAGNATSTTAAKASSAVSSAAKAATGTGAANRESVGSFVGLAAVAGFAAMI